MTQFMKCTNAWQIDHQLHIRMTKELKLAIQAHGGEYSWYSEENGEYVEEVPIVLCNHDYAGPLDIKIRRVYIDNYGCVSIEAATNENDDEIPVDLEYIVASHIQSIIECIPVTDMVNDVSIP